MLIVPLGQREFDLYALSLPRGPNFEPMAFHAAWKARSASAVAAVFKDPAGRFHTLVMRRQTDHRFITTHEGKDFGTEGAAMQDIGSHLRPEEAAERVPPGTKKRPALVTKDFTDAGESFKLLATTLQHYPALMAVGETYLAMPVPDDNFVSDFRTRNFDARMWELYLLAAFREQGIFVAQDQPSPDFLLEREGHRCYVEAVTANPNDLAERSFSPPKRAPEDPEERLLGAPAVRFAKTLRSKLQREYERLPFVHGTPFALAIADFHAPSSMTWSREALPSYLYGIHPQVADGPDGPHAIGPAVSTLRGSDRIPAGLFRNPDMAHLSAVIFSNAATISKFNRMGFLAGWRPPGLKMTRMGDLYDRTPGALKSIPFEMNILSDEYTSLWPGGEAWCQELEVFHNPLAKSPIDLDLIPGATHWFERDGEIVCSSIWQWSVLSSVTMVMMKQ